MYKRLKYTYYKDMNHEHVFDDFFTYMNMHTFETFNQK